MAVILDVKNVSFSYDGKENIFDNVSFSLEKGDIISILGRNGIGKSTLIKCLINFYSVRSGSISIMERDINDYSLPDLAKVIGYVPQGHETVFPFSTLDFVLMGRSPHLSFLSSPAEKDVEIAKKAIEKLGVGYLMDKNINEISGGERQMIMLARALAQEAKILILDEPTSHLDFGNQFRVLKAISRLSDEGIAIIMSTHFPDHAFMISSKVAVMHDRKFIAIGNACDVITKDNLKKAYGVDVSVSYVDDAKRDVCAPVFIR
ncbi:iron complex transport system ATP-binding protein [Methanomicrobium sp. W14]|uniref:ABC transporter ATP-binding protein n=1 Tax=Methanomicrobium sp. W14 TaxID=2817839 RepID=UPI001FDA19DB|nr:ABC transporter ATP-binding protein [Methanomicrobium sp. W14]MBP2134416.1 iron complex transport system ATP-binding protein [Methanomicrobium sp. W14]